MDIIVIIEILSDYMIIILLYFTEIEKFLNINFGHMIVIEFNYTRG